MKSKIGQIMMIVLAVYLVLGVAFYFIAGDSLHKASTFSDTVTPKATIGEFEKDQIIEQTFTCKYDSLDQLAIHSARASTDIVRFEVLNSSGTTVYATDMDMAQTQPTVISAWEYLYIIPLDQPLNDAKDQSYTLRMTSLSGVAGVNALLPYCGNAVDTGRFSIAVNVPTGTINGEQIVDNEKLPASIWMC